MRDGLGGDGVMGGFGGAKPPQEHQGGFGGGEAPPNMRPRGFMMNNSIYVPIYFLYIKIHKNH